MGSDPGLEEAFVSCLDSTQEYLALQQQLAQQLKQGLFSLAKAKYTMGPIGQSQYNMDMRASAQVRVAGPTEEASAAATFEYCEGGGVRQQQAQDGARSDASAGSDDDDDEDLEAEFALLRMLRDRSGDGDGAASNSTTQQQQEPQSLLCRRAAGGGKHRANSKKPTEALHWFGVLVPPALKDAQAQYTQALRTCIRLANVAGQVQAQAAAANGRQ